MSNVPISNADTSPPVKRRPAAAKVWPGIVLMLAALALDGAATSAEARGLSLPGINSLQRKIFGRKHRSNKRQQSAPANTGGGTPAGTTPPSVPAAAVPAATAAAVLSGAVVPPEVPPLPERNPGRLNKRIAVTLPAKGTAVTPAAPPPAAWPKPEKTPLPPSQIEAEAWTAAFIAKAEDQCTSQLANLAIESRTLPPIREGICGAPAVRLLSGVSTAPRVEIEPPATLSCQMVAGLALWLRDDVQLLAKKLLGSEVKRLTNVSSYVCRNRYGDADGVTGGRISEHAYANALDVSSFELADGRKITVAEGWTDEASGQAAFLHALHSAACKRFGTVLGPDANAAHKDHLHLDMAPRKRDKYCR